jgi:uncharacterized protein (DUF1501 family)
MTTTRRSFLRTSTGVPVFWRAALEAAVRTDSSGTVLVVLQLAGGNDGLNTVVPYEDDEYARHRSTLRLTGSQVHKIGASLGFHPKMRGFARLFQEGRMAVLQGVGYPEMHRDHNVGMRSWQTGSVLPDEPTGWLGRIADQAADPDAGNVPAVFVGNIPQPLAIHARRSVVPSIREAKDWTVRGASFETTPAAGTDLLLTFAARTTAAACKNAGRMSDVLRADRGKSYPPYNLAQSLRTVAQLMRAELGIRVYLTEQGGVSPGEFDNHANQAVNHAVSLRELSDSVAAFCDDLAQDKLLDRVLLMTYSEFGRTLSENGRHGTGHGSAAPVFLAGGKLNGGLIGGHPSLTDLDNDALKPHTDFRAVYATVLERWLGIESAPILGRRFPLLDVLA